MTTKDIRDIAAYWGCPVTGSVIKHFVRENVMVDYAGRLLDEVVLQSLQAVGPYDFKLHLRPLSSLTDEQVYECFRLAFGEEAQSRTLHGIDRDRGKIEVYAYGLSNYELAQNTRFDLSIWEDTGLMAATTWTSGETYKSAIWNAGGVIAYLQSISVYVPGTIDEKYVRLIES